LLIERIEPAQPGVDYPRLLNAQGRCPPEDVGGPRGYAEYLSLGDPTHKRYAEMVGRRGASFDPKVVDIDAITKNLLALARKWSRTRTPKRP
jgi:hypothetical protein